MTVMALEDQTTSDPQGTERALIELIGQYMQRQQPARVGCCTDSSSVEGWLRKHAPYAGRLQQIKADHDAKAESWDRVFARAHRTYCTQKQAV